MTSKVRLYEEEREEDHALENQWKLIDMWKEYTWKA